MAVLQTGQSFSSGDQVTATKLQYIANLATFRTGANQTADAATIEVDGSAGFLRVKSSGITSNELATDSVITAKIQDGAVTAAKLDSAATSVLMPTGAIMPYAGATAPGGYLFCDGSEYSETGTYSNLFSVIQSTYNTGGETTSHFRVPDLRGRVIAGQDDMGGSSADTLTDTQADQLGGTLGNETHTLTTTELPAHTHGGLTNIDPNGGDGGSASDPGLDYVTSNGAGTVSGSTGGGGAHQNVQPTFILNYIIKT